MTAGMGVPGDESLRAWVCSPERKPRAPCPGPTVTRSPVFVARISLHIERVDGGDKKAAEFKSTRIALNRSRRWVSLPITGSPEQEPRSPGVPPVAGASLMEALTSPEVSRFK
jgi:hypothetical protein